MKTLLKRSLSGAVFVFVLLSCILLGYNTFALLFFVVSLWALKEFYEIAEKLGALPYKICGYICAMLLYSLLIDGLLILPERPFEYLTFFRPLVFIIPIIIFAVAMFNKRNHAITNAAFTLSGIIYCVLPFALMLQMVSEKNESQTSEYSYHLILGVILLIWSNDTFAYLGGSLFGKHKMIVRVSPGKTWEGTIFGVLVTFGLSFFLVNLLPVCYNSLWPILGVLVPIAATIGDLVESALKRQAGVKDSGKIMPGHGGVLDRFDSLIFVAPLVFAIVKLL